MTPGMEYAFTLLAKGIVVYLGCSLALVVGILLFGWYMAVKH